MVESMEGLSEFIKIIREENSAEALAGNIVLKPPNTINDHHSPLLWLYWYLYTGTEDSPKCFPKRLKLKNQFTPDKVTCVPKLVKDLTNAKCMVDAIKHVKAGHHLPERCVYALALGIASTEKVSTADSIRSLLYNTASTIFTTSDEILFFVKSLAVLKTGVGKGWRNCLTKWYKNMPSEKLAIEVSRAKSRYGWTHKDILKLIHFKEDAANQPLTIIFHYIWNGLKLTLEKYGSVKECENILTILKALEELRHTEDGTVAAGLLAAHSFLGLDHVPVHLISNPEVWDVLILKMTPTDIAYNIERLHLSLLVANPDVTTVPTELLPRPVTQKLMEALDKMAVSPLLAYMTLMNYQAGGKPRSHAKQTFVEKDRKAKLTLLTRMVKKTGDKDNRLMKVWQSQKHKGIVMPPDLKLIRTLYEFVDMSITEGYKCQNKIDAHFLMALDLSNTMFKGFQQVKSDYCTDKCKLPRTNREKHAAAECFGNKNLVPGHVALILAQELSCRVKNVTVVIMTPDGLEELDLKINGIPLSFTQLLSKAEEYMSKSVKRFDLSSPIMNAVANKKKYDLFINVIHSVCRYRFNYKCKTAPILPAIALKTYHETVGSRDAGLVTVSLGGHKGATSQLEDGRRILDVFGVDEHIVNLITTFATTAKDKI